MFTIESNGILELFPNRSNPCSFRLNLPSVFAHGHALELSLQRVEELTDEDELACVWSLHGREETEAVCVVRSHEIKWMQQQRQLCSGGPTELQCTAPIELSDSPAVAREVE